MCHLIKGKITVLIRADQEWIPMLRLQLIIQYNRTDFKRDTCSADLMVARVCEWYAW